MPRILDNLTPDGDSQMEEALSDTLATSRALDVAVGYFNLRGWGLIADRVGDLSGEPGRPAARVLVGMTEDPREEMRRLMSVHPSPETDAEMATERLGRTVDEFRAQLEVGLPTPTDEAALRELRRQIDDGVVDVRLYLRHRLHAKLYLAHRDDVPVPRVGYAGSSNLTQAGLRDQGELNVDVTDIMSTEKLADWFDERWNDPFTVPVNPELVRLIDGSWAGATPLEPYLVYLKMAYHLSQEAREGLIQFGLPASMARQLLKFQEAAVKIAARIVLDRGGVMIGDVVGLGKTMVATAIARLLQEDHGWETLIVCPKNLVPMWESYQSKYRLHGKVLSLSMAARKLPQMTRHRLVVVDESHNLRNPGRIDHQALRRYISDNDSKVVLLSATPYNKSLDDLNGQLSLFVDEHADLGIRPNLAIAERGEDLFSIECEGRTSSLVAFRRSEHLEDWQTLMSQFMVRRTRRFIEDNYAGTDRRGRKFLTFGDKTRFYFPERIPRPVERALTPTDPAIEMLSDTTLDAVKNLKRPRYSLHKYLTGADPADEDEQQLISDLRRAARGTLDGFNRVMMFKRLSSSGPAFLLTLRRHLLRDRVFLHAVEQDRPIPVGPLDRAVWDLGSGTENDGIFGDDEFGLTPEQAYQQLVTSPPPKLRWLGPEHLDDVFVADLTDDIDTIEEMLERFGRWDQATDGKVNTLARIVLERHRGEKVLVFTEYTDTAAYVLRALELRGVQDVAMVTGQTGNATELARRFSPGSHPFGLDESEEGLRVLISTDVLSEGQNLQDARIVVNYDLPWAIVKLVQRAGRVDRIGQAAEQVVLYTLLPAASVEEEIDLRSRIRDRLEENARLLGSDEQFLGDAREREVVAGLFDEHSEWDLGGVDEVDPVSMAYEIWRTAERDHPELAKRVEAMPNVVYATLESAPNDKGAPGSPGVLVHSQTVTGSDAFAVVHRSGDARSISPQDALRMAECKADTPPRSALTDHHDLVAAAFDGPLTTPPEKVAVVPTGVRGRCYEKLKTYKSSPQLDLLAPEEDLGAALEDIRRFPLQPSALQTLARAVRERTPADLAALIVGLHREQMLCEHPDTLTTRTEPRVICSMGFV